MRKYRENIRFNKRKEIQQNPPKKNTVILLDFRYFVSDFKQSNHLLLG